MTQRREMELNSRREGVEWRAEKSGKECAFGVASLQKSNNISNARKDDKYRKKREQAIEEWNWG